MKKKTLSLDIAVLLETSTMHQLTSNTNVFFDTPRQQSAGKVQLAHVQYIPAVNDGVLIVKADTRSSDKSYETTIQFVNVKYVGGDAPYAVPLQANGQEISIMPIRANQNDVQVHCTCMDFYWRFAMYNNKNKSLIGEPPAPYVKKTDRAPNNPDQVPGACKHLMRLANQLRMEKILK